MAGGIIIVLGLKINEDGSVEESNHPLCGNELGTGIHRGKILLRTDENLEENLGIGAKLFEICESELKQIDPLLDEYCEIFHIPGDRQKGKQVLGNC